MKQQATDEVIDKIISHYDNDGRHALAVMQDMQDQLGYVPAEGLRAMSAYFHRSVGELYALTTFYKALSLKPKGRHVIKVCDGTACHIRGAANLSECLERELGIVAGETSADGTFSWEKVHCVSACALAPVVMVDSDMYGPVKVEEVPRILDKYRDEGGEA